MLHEWISLLEQGVQEEVTVRLLAPCLMENLGASLLYCNKTCSNLDSTPNTSATPSVWAWIKPFPVSPTNLHWSQPSSHQARMQLSICLQQWLCTHRVMLSSTAGRWEMLLCAAGRGGLCFILFLLIITEYWETNQISYLMSAFHKRVFRPAADR